MQARVGVKEAVLRMGWFGAMLYFTFAAPLLPAAILGWISLGVLFYCDFF